jgi:hypothetical protein
MCVCVCVCVCLCVCVCVCLCVCIHIHIHTHRYTHTYIYIYLYVYTHIYLSTYVFIYTCSVSGGWTATCACCVFHRPVARAFSAGLSWATRATSALWAARAGHTTVVDHAAGAIYVIGGITAPHCYNDVLKSTDGGARLNLVGGCSRG